MIYSLIGWILAVIFFCRMIWSEMHFCKRYDQMILGREIDKRKYEADLKGKETEMAEIRTHLFNAERMLDDFRAGITYQVPEFMKEDVNHGTVESRAEEISDDEPIGVDEGCEVFHISPKNPLPRGHELERAYEKPTYEELGDINIYGISGKLLMFIEAHEETALELIDQYSITLERSEWFEIDSSLQTDIIHKILFATAATSTHEAPHLMTISLPIHEWRQIKDELNIKNPLSPQDTHITQSPQTIDPSLDTMHIEAQA